jgi:hypothetical protein
LDFFLIAIIAIILSIYLGYFVKEGFSKKSKNSPVSKIKPVSTQTSAYDCYVNCNGDGNADSYSEFKWCDLGYWNVNATIGTETCPNNEKCVCQNKRT